MRLTGNLSSRTLERLSGRDPPLPGLERTTSSRGSGRARSPACQYAVRRRWRDGCSARFLVLELVLRGGEVVRRIDIEERVLRLVGPFDPAESDRLRKAFERTAA